MTRSKDEEPRAAPKADAQQGPHRTPRSEQERAAREARLAAEMRKNLQRRKQQTRGRDAPGER